MGIPLAERSDKESLRRADTIIANINAFQGEKNRYPSDLVELGGFLGTPVPTATSYRASADFHYWLTPDGFHLSFLSAKGGIVGDYWEYESGEGWIYSD